MKVFFYQALIVHIILNIYVFIRGWQVLPKKNAYRIPYALLFIVELIVYLIGLIFNVSLPAAILKPILLIGTSWMVFIGYTTALLLIYDLIKFLRRKFDKIQKLNLQRGSVKRRYIIISLIVIISSMTYGHYRFWHPVVTELDLKVDKKVDGLKSLRVVMVADVHAGHLIDKKVLSMYVDKIMEQKPDVILLVGDIIDYDLPPLIDQKMDEEFRRLKAPYGVYVSTGNHEYRLNGEEKIAWLGSETGMTMLRDTAIKVADKFYIVGREDDHATKRKSLSDIMQHVDKQLPVIVMNHEPKQLSEESTEQADLAVYGHTHNGQLFPNNLIMSLIYEVGHGYKKKENTHIYVTSGLGLAGPQYRIGTISEIVVLNLKFN
ncbi:metallophosphoesterase [Dysgonomonas sp. GY617]|uniref:metallophosphoesterase n=1 Tax=Dysgonomonas sp. GY617 TaxID=2780420 RepID=UPI001883951E|nr:metallophosphoesterase [Dysgonomonas sp. GY617]MBF0577663.1 metallophosphoesterase [Dysgonomonas sp. GY617]